MDRHHIYVDRLEREVQYCYQLASRARQQRLDPENEVNIPLAKNMAERVAGIISIVAPQLIASPMAERIQELEKEYSKLDWRVGFQIAEEVAREKFCRFADQREAVEVGIRVGFAYLTLGIVAAPLEGFIGLKIKKTAAGKEYLSLQYAGPIRGAGGTAAASSVILADYVRVKMGYAPYDPTEQEINRSVTEVHDYHERVTNLQYHPSNEELDFLLRRLPVEVDGDPTEEIEVSNYKDLPRIETNLIRGGVCLVLAEGLSQKAPKLWKKLKSWGKEWGIDWSFLEQFLELQKKIKAKESAGKNSETADHQKIKPNFTYINDLVAGRPILTHPLQKGGFRLRYGRSRTTGFSTAGFHPATLVVLDKYIAIGTQLKVERPGKAVTVALCDTIEGPVVKTKDGSVIVLHTEKQAKEICSSVDEILFLGDILINYGDFSENGHLLVPAGYCEEWWAGEVQRVFQQRSLSAPEQAALLGLSEERLRLLCDFPLTTIPSVEEAVRFSQQLGVPWHPYYTYHWKHLSGTKLQELQRWFLSGRVFVEQGKIKKFILPVEKEYASAKYSLEEIGLPHVIANSVMAVIEEPAGVVLDIFFSLTHRERCQSLAFNEEQDALTQLNALGPFLQRDKSGTFIGARMGRPEKVKMRKLTGSPQVMFPVGGEGDRLRSFQAALERGSITADFPNFFCSSCAQETIYPRCERCQQPTELRYYCRQCGDLSVRCRHDYVTRHKKKKLDVRHYFTSAQQQVGMQTTPDLIKGVRGTSNKDHMVEHLAKGLLRAKHDVYVNKDGTIRVDCTEMPLTHFKPKEIGTPIEKLRALGYETDIAGRSLDNEDQIVELQPQDIVLPNFPALEGSCGQALLSVGKFIDDLLINFYGQEAYYQFTSERDLIGHLVVGLAPHISAGLIGRIIGFSETQVLLAHPLWHAGLRRDCDGDEAAVMLLLDALLNFSRQFLPNTRGSTMDSPLVLTSILNPSEVDDQVHGIDVVWKYPVELYEAALQYQYPWEVKVEQLKTRVGTEKQYSDFGFTHQVDNFNNGITCSAYKILPTMEEKLAGQMELARKIRAVDTEDVAKLVIEKHLIRDIRGNLRKFSTQQFRCVKCNAKYRRPPLIGCCTKCRGNLLFTISEGSATKYLQLSLSLAEKYDFSPYLKQSLEITKNNIDTIFGREKEKQIALGTWVT